MPKMTHTTETRHTARWEWTREELLACLGITTEPGDQVGVQGGEGLVIEVVHWTVDGGGDSRMTAAWQAAKLKPGG